MRIAFPTLAAKCASYRPIPPTSCRISPRHPSEIKQNLGQEMFNYISRDMFYAHVPAVLCPGHLAVLQWRVISHLL